jgi:hypothetical protein
MRIAILMLVLASSVCANFSHTTTIKGAGPVAGAVTRPKTKGDKMQVDTGSSVIMMAEKAMAAMGGTGAGKYPMEIRSESSEFAIPAGFKKADR